VRESAERTLHVRQLPKIHILQDEVQVYSVTRFCPPEESQQLVDHNVLKVVDQPEGGWSRLCEAKRAVVRQLNAKGVVPKGDLVLCKAFHATYGS
jgi:hypothetical protein